MVCLFLELGKEGKPKVSYGERGVKVRRRRRRWRKKKRRRSDVWRR